MKKVLLILLSVSFLGASFAQKSKLEQDREAIKAMRGCYKVSFDFAETFASDTAYKYHDNYHSWGIELVKIIEETETKISLQHLLVVNDTMIVKHWRQDWIYENQELLSFYKDREWKKVTLTPEQVKGTWTQKVFQVDDSPRYESYGTWNHVDGRHFWEARADSPLPRREFSKRSDYNVMNRFSHYELLNDGWIYEQDNQKVVRENGEDKIICEEKGIERFTTGNYNCQPAIDWWEKNHNYWTDVRAVWDDIYAKHSSLKLQKKVDDTLLFMALFGLGDKYEGTENYNSKEAQKEIRETINKYIVK